MIDTNVEEEEEVVELVADFTLFCGIFRVASGKSELVNVGVISDDGVVDGVDSLCWLERMFKIELTCFWTLSLLGCFLPPPNHCAPPS